MILDSKSLIFILVELDEHLTGVLACLGTGPFDKILEALGVLKNGADSAETASLEACIACLSEIKKDIDSLDIQEVKL